MTDTNSPEAIKLKRDLNLPPALDEWRMLTELRSVATKNTIYRSYIGMGFYDCIVPGVILRNIFQSAGWITRWFYA
jgi:glycine dehydrogenase